MFDEYARTKTLRSGAFLVFDELLNYPEYREHEMKALWLFLREQRWEVWPICAAGPEVVGPVVELKLELNLLGSAESVRLKHFNQNALVRVRRAGDEENE